MRRILVIGAGGMLAHKLMQVLSTRHQVIGTVRRPVSDYRRFGIFDLEQLVGDVDVEDFDSVEKVVKRVHPDFVVNCVGIVKQIEAANDPLVAISINALFPHRLARLCRETNVRMIHISTDCVFSGNKGGYKETDIPDPIDLYGRTKLLGEVETPNCLTLRTSIIGRELDSRNGLIEWFLHSGPKVVQGFRRAIFSGFTTLEFSRIIESVMESKKQLTGLYQVSSEPINKYELLLLAREAFGLSGEIIPSDTLVIDRSLDSARFRLEMNYCPPSWPEMIRELAADETPYPRW